MSDVPAILGFLAGLIPSIFKHKPFCLWYRNEDGRWTMEGGPFSARQCRKTMKTLVYEVGHKPGNFAILRKGVTP